jgi:hypothetical protein
MDASHTGAAEFIQQRVNNSRGTDTDAMERDWEEVGVLGQDVSL